MQLKKMSIYLEININFDPYLTLYADIYPKWIIQLN